MTFAKKHGYAGTKDLTYSSWMAMRGRCNVPGNQAYADYGGRGITVCARWDDFTVFLADMGPRPSKAHTIERKDNNGNYEPGNCCWGTKKQQGRNRRTNKRYEFRGQHVTLLEALEMVGNDIEPRIVWNRIVRMKWPFALAVETPKMSRQERRPQ